MKTNLFFFLIFLCYIHITIAQTKSITYYDLPVHGKLFATSPKYDRVDTAKYSDLPKNVKYLYTNTAGLFVSFKSNAPAVSAKWCVSDKKIGLNLTAIASKGLDVYIKNSAGAWQYAGSKGTAKVCEEAVLVENLDSTMKEFLVYLPIYDVITSLEIGVGEGFKVEPLQNPFKLNIAVYGSSIVHGASAGRAGMAYPAILSRRTGLNFINLGVSGNAKIEKEVAHMLGEANPDVFILDCVPNSLPAIIAERTEYFVSYLRSKHPNTPIIMIPSVVRELSYFNQVWKKRNADQNAQFKVEYEALLAKGITGLYYLDTDNLLGDDHEGTTDGTHPNDLGFMRMADKIEPFVLEVMRKHKLL